MSASVSGAVQVRFWSWAASFCWHAKAAVRLLSLLFLPAAAYQLLSLYASLRHAARRWSVRPAVSNSSLPGVSVLKPMRGLDPAMHEAFLSQAQQDYPEYELLFGVRDPDDPAVAEVRRLQEAFPAVPIRLFIGSDDAPNGKVAVLSTLSRHARYPVWVVNDSDIKVTPDYLRQVVAPLADSRIGVVTCLYRPEPHSLATAWETLGVSTDFIPSTLVAQVMGVREFGLGSTLVFRADDLQRAGGFGPIGDYLADDYQIAKRIQSLGMRCLLSTYVVDTSFGNAGWSGVWQHQLRWARTIRLTKGAGYAGLPITHAAIWALIALAAGLPQVAIGLVCLRILSALASAGLVLRSRLATGFAWLTPLWDVYAFLIWIASYAGRDVRWRDRALYIDAHGKIIGPGR
jgi:ceramide glucosyltransferase